MLRIAVVLISMLFAPAHAASSFVVKTLTLDGFEEDAAHGITRSALDAQFNYFLQQHRQLLTLNDLNLFADHLTSLYRDTGLNFHRVMVPTQDITDGDVHLQLIPGKLGDVHVINAQLYSTPQLQKPFADLLQQAADASRTEAAVQLLNTYPGLSVFSYYSRGAAPGEARVNVNVQNETPFQILVRADNHGVETTGEYRLLTQINANNLLGMADQITLLLLQSASPQNASAAQLSWRMPLDAGWNYLSVQYSNNQFDIGGDFAALGVNGDGDQLRLDFTHIQHLSRQHDWRWLLWLDDKQSGVANDLDPTQLNSDQGSQGIGAGMSWKQSFNRWQQQLSVQIYNAEYSEGFAILDGERFSRANLNALLAWNVAAQQQLQFSVRLQNSSDVLPSYEYTLLTGANAVRAYSSDQGAVDSGVVSSLQWSWLQKKYSPYVFFDVANGEQHNIDTTQTQDISAAGYGLGLRFAPFKNFSGNVSFAQGSGLEFNNVEQTTVDDSRVWLEVQYVF